MTSENNIQLSSLNGITKVYFIGIGGIGMSAIARYFLSKGIQVSGYDSTGFFTTHNSALAIAPALEITMSAAA